MLARALPDGGTIGVPSPSSPYENRSEIDRGVRWWESRGFKVKLGSGIHERSDYVAGDPKTRARDLNELFADPDQSRVERAMTAMLQMHKLDIEALQRAADGAAVS